MGLAPSKIFLVSALPPTLKENLNDLSKKFWTFGIAYDPRG